MKTYISGPMTGLPEFNFPAFFRAEQKLKAEGEESINPARSFEGRTDIPYEVYLGEDSRILLEEASAVYLLPGFSKSRGVQFEILIALGLGLPIYMEAAPSGEDSAKFEELKQIHSEAHALVYGDRAESYGHPKDDYERTSVIFKAMTAGKMMEGIGLSPLEGIKFMISVKISRELNKSKLDNLVDLCGYSICYRRVKEKLNPTEENIS